MTNQFAVRFFGVSDDGHHVFSVLVKTQTDSDFLRLRSCDPPITEKSRRELSIRHQGVCNENETASLHANLFAFGETKRWIRLRSEASRRISRDVPIRTSVGKVNRRGISSSRTTTDQTEGTTGLGEAE